MKVSNDGTLGYELPLIEISSNIFVTTYMADFRAISQLGHSSLASS